jgi:DNA polymerase III delta subunit
MAKPVYALVGTDVFLQLQELARILAQMPADVQRSDFDGDSAQLAEILDELRSFAMFGGGKLVTVRNADKFLTNFREQLEEYVARPSDSGTLVLRLSSLPANQRIYKLIQKTGQVVSCEPPKDLARWAIEHAKTAHKVALALDAARLLVELIGEDLGRLDTEIAKLAINADGGKITSELVTTNVAFTREREMWDLTNAMAVGNTTEALRRWRQLIQSDPSAEFRAVTWLGIWLGEVGLVVNEGPRSAAVNKLRWKYKGDAFDKFVAGANALGKDGYARALDLLTEIDKQSKSGVGDAAENVERFILSLSTAELQLQRR